MKKTTILKSFLCAGVAGGIAVSAHAQVLLQDNFDSYADQAAFEAVWTTVSSNAMTLDSSLSASSPNSVTQGAGTQSSYQAFTSTSGNILDVTFDLYDPAATNEGRSYLALQSRTGDLYSDGLNQLIAFGRYNNVSGGTYYYGRVAFGSGIVLGDGASDLTSSWFLLGGASATTSIGWHEMRLLGMPDADNPTTHMKLEFYVDGDLAGSVANVANQDYNLLVLGSNLTSSAAGGASFDNVSVIPEPSTYAAIFGGLALVGAFVYRRRVTK